MARFQCQMQNFWKESAKWSFGSLTLLVQSLMPLAPGQGRKLLSERGRGFRRACNVSTNPCGERCALRVKWSRLGSMIKVRPRLLCLIIVALNVFWFCFTDWWLPYLRYAWKFLSVACALHRAGAPVVRMRLRLANTSLVRMGCSFFNVAVTLMCLLTWGPPIQRTTDATSPL